MAQQFAERQTGFGIGIGELFRAGIRAFLDHPLPLLAASSATFLTYAGFRYMASQSSSVLAGIGFDLIGLVLSSVVALPWYRAALDAVDGSRSTPSELVGELRSFRDQFVASLFFWAGVLFGLRYLFGLPSIFVVVMYAFYGFVVSEQTHPGGLRALGKSVLLGQRRRIGIGAIGALLLILNLFGAIALGFEDLGPATRWALTIAGLLVTTNVSMAIGAVLYRHVQRNPA